MINISTKNELQNQISKNTRVLALFYTSWCTFCKRFMNIFNEDWEKNSFDIVLCVKLDDYSNSLWEDYSIDNVPTVIFFKNGKIAERIDGESGLGLNRSQFVSLLNKCKNNM
jgi:thioredoxin 1